MKTTEVWRCAESDQTRMGGIEFSIRTKTKECNSLRRNHMGGR